VSNFTAIITGLALASILVAAVSVRQGLRAGGEARPSKPAFEARQVDMPVPPKADRLPLPAIAAPEPPAPAVEPLPFLRAQLEPPAPNPRVKPGERDPVCGPRGRVWYTKDNGYRYWKCIR
jgi:hypothetical protein